ncbi:MAG: hydrogenase maturation nickel metallochaperone HypA [Rhodoferax sp.]|uniref:hydrogenase maturation nickel metallochaperone HypA n=1 Tax=Rhodoferax sp. TaxID=50421 RepID=UPI003019F0A8
MHELSLAGGILQMLEQTRARDPFKRVMQLRLEAGALSGVDSSALRFALESIAPGTCLENAIIEIEEPAALAWCPHCSQSVQIQSRIDPCPLCAGFQLQVTSGSELRIMDLQVV